MFSTYAVSYRKCPKLMTRSLVEGMVVNVNYFPSEGVVFEIKSPVTIVLFKPIP